MCAMTAGSTANEASGSKPSSSFRPRTAAVPSLLPCAECEPVLPGTGHAIRVRNAMNDGLSVTALAAAMAAASASTSSRYSPPAVQSTICVCQP